MTNFIFLFSFSILSLITAIVMLSMGYIFSYKSPDKEKSSTYECGIRLGYSSKLSFNIKFFNYLVMFLILDISTIFLYPLLITIVEYSKPYLFFVLIYLAILLFSIIYSFKFYFIGNVKGKLNE